MRPAVKLTLGVALVVALCGVAAAKPGDAPSGSIQVHGDNIKWTAGPASLPPGAQVAILEGDPRRRGIFTMRLKVSEGTRIAPHSHPRAERVTILEGKVGVGFGKRFDKGRLRYFKKGDFYVNPPKSNHFIHFARDSVVQVTGEGPWEVHYLDQPAR